MSAPTETTLALCLTPHCKLCRANDNVLDLLGYPAQALLKGQPTFISLIHSDDQDIALRLFALEPTRETGQVVLRLRHADGRIRCTRGDYAHSIGSDGEHWLALGLINVKNLVHPFESKHRSASFIAMMINTDDYIVFKSRHRVFVGASQTLVNITQPLCSFFVLVH